MSFRCSQCKQYATDYHVLHQQAHCNNCNANVNTEVTESLTRQSKIIKTITVIGVIAIFLIPIIFIIGR